ncbi:hypothetical protein N7528_002603 [Penicillium herquei]|nr:hypothetical protein N7528_002603 [Penicillium herquei]
MPKQQAKRNQQPPVKAACLSCQRGGIRRGPYFITQDNVTSLPSTQINPLFHQMRYDSQQWSPITDFQTSDTNDHPRYHGVDGILDLLNPSAGIRNLDIPFTDTPSHLSQNPTNEDYTGNLKNLYNDPRPQLRIYTSEQDMYDTSADQPYITPNEPTAISTLGLNESVIDRSCLSYWPTSSLTLAISAILALIPLPDDPNPYSTPSIHLRRLHAHLYADAAFSEVDNEIDGISAICSHPRIDSSMETGSCGQSQLSPITALILLSVYEYCQRGNISRMRSRANQAVTAAMDLSLHNLGSRATDAQRRTWWSAPWSLLLEAEKSILTISELSDKHRINNVNPPNDVSQALKKFNSQLSDIIKKVDRLPDFTTETELERKASQNIWLIARLLVHSARIRLHRARAFRDTPMFLEKYCDLTAIQDKTEGIADLGLGLTNTKEFAATFPFTEQESSVMCFKSSLVIARALENLPLRSASTPYILPYFVCAAMQSAYVLLTSYYRIRAALESGHLSLYHYLLNCPEPDSENQDAERLIRELRQGMESIIGALKLAQMFEGVGGMSQEILIAYQAAILTD